MLELLLQFEIGTWQNVHEFDWQVIKSAKWASQFVLWLDVAIRRQRQTCHQNNEGTLSWAWEWYAQPLGIISQFPTQEGEELWSDDNDGPQVDL